MQNDWAAALCPTPEHELNATRTPIRIVARAWLRVIWACSTSGRPTTRTGITPDRHHSSRSLHRCHPAMQELSPRLAQR
jgi:hypothetical protein